MQYNIHKLTVLEFLIVLIAIYYHYLHIIPSFFLHLLSVQDALLFLFRLIIPTFLYNFAIVIL